MTFASYEIPFWHPDAISLGPLELHPFGILVATGVLLGVHIMRRWADRDGLEDRHVQGLVWYCVGIGFICAHVFDVLAYQPGKLADDPLLLFKLWQGISSYGGFLGGVIGYCLYVWRYKIPVGPYADACLIAFIPGFTFGRMGCTVAHDHIGAYTENFFLATEYTRETILRYGFGSPPGGLKPGLHHNLGFYELLFMLILCLVLFLADRWRKRPHGFLAALMGTLYAPVRFIMEFFRVNPDADPRYFGFTPAQWLSIVLFCAGVFVLIRLVRHGNNLPMAELLAERAEREQGANPDAGKKKGAGQTAKKSAKKSGKGSGSGGKKAGSGGSKSKKRKKK